MQTQMSPETPPLTYKSIVAIDFDGTIVEDIGNYPNHGPFLPMAKRVLLSMMACDKIKPVIFSLRGSHGSKERRIAEQFLLEHGVDGLKWSNDFIRQQGGKFPYDILIDDRSLSESQNDPRLWEKVIYRMSSEFSMRLSRIGSENFGLCRDQYGFPFCANDYALSRVDAECQRLECIAMHSNAYGEYHTIWFPGSANRAIVYEPDWSKEITTCYALQAI